MFLKWIGLNLFILFVRDIFTGSSNYMKNITIIRQVVNKLNEIDFNASEDPSYLCRYLLNFFALFEECE